MITENSLIQVCFSFSATQAFGLISAFKADAERALQSNNLRFAMDYYNQALSVIDAFSFVPFVRDEFHKIICNRALVSLRMRRYREAEEDANLCIDCRPDFTKVTIITRIPFQ